MHIKSMLLYAKGLRGAHSALRALTKGFWAHDGHVPNGGICIRLEGSSGSLDDSQQHNQSIQPGSSSPSQGSFADPYACSPQTAHQPDSSGLYSARPLACLPWKHQHQSRPAIDVVRGFSDQRRSHTFADYTSTPGPWTPHRPPLSQMYNSRYFSDGQAQILVAEANSILRVRLILHSNHMTHNFLQVHTTQPS